MRVCSCYSLAHNNGFGKLSIVGEITGGVHNKWKQKQEWYKNAGDADSPSLFNHFEYADATSWEWIRWQEKAWHWYGIQSMQYIGEKRRQMCGTTQWWDYNDFSRLKPPGSGEGRTGLLDYTRSPLTCSIL